MAENPEGTPRLKQEGELRLLLPRQGRVGDQVTSDKETHCGPTVIGGTGAATGPFDKAGGGLTGHNSPQALVAFILPPLYGYSLSGMDCVAQGPACGFWPRFLRKQFSFYS